MFSSLLTIVLAALLTQPAYSSPVTSFSPTRTLPANCTSTVLEFPPIETNCTFYHTTSTSTVFTDCKGCALETEVLGLGLPCRAITRLDGTATKTVTACKTG